MATPTSLPATFVAGNVLTAAEMNNLRGAFRILQVVSTTKTDTFSAALSPGGTASITGLTATITPTSTDSKVFIIVNIHSVRTNAAEGGLQITRGGTSIGAGTTAGNRTGVVSYVKADSTSNNSMMAITGMYLDSPATTSATTYGVDLYAVATDTYYVNRTDVDSDSSANPRQQSTITVMEVSA